MNIDFQTFVSFIGLFEKLLRSHLNELKLNVNDDTTKFFIGLFAPTRLYFMLMNYWYWMARNCSWRLQS